MREHADVEVERGRGGSLSLQVSNAIGRLRKEFVGRGPTKVRSYLDDDLVVCVLEGGFTRSERTIRDHSGHDLVIEMRLRLQAVMRSAITDVVQKIMGREVRSFMSANDPNNDLQVEMLLLLGGDMDSAVKSEGLGVAMGLRPRDRDELRAE